MSDLKAIIDAVKGIESTLVEQFGAEGRGLHEKLTSVEAQVPSHLQRSIRYLATLRNKAMHEEGYEIKDPEAYVRQANEARAQLLALSKPKPATTAPVPVAATVPQTPNKLLVLGIAALMVGGIWFVASMIQPRSNNATAPVGAVSHREPVKTPTPASPVAESRPNDVTLPPVGGVVSREPVAPKVVPAASEPAVNNGSLPETMHQRGSAAMLHDAITAGQSVGVGNGALRIDVVEFSTAVGSWGRAEPQISLTVTNIADKTVSSARAEAMLFINGNDTPSVQTKDLFVYMGEQGLQSGETRKVKISSDLRFDWNAPDVLNAEKRAVAVRITSSDDGMNRAIGGAAPQFPWKVNKQPVRSVSGEVQDVDMRAQIAAGFNVGAGNTVVHLGTPNIKVGGGSFGRDVEISVEVENISQFTVSSVTADALLFLNGNTVPAVGDKEVIRFYFGERGLAPSERKLVRATIDHFKSHRWRVPDIQNATSRLVVLRVSSTADGMRNPFGGAGKPLPWEIPK